MTDTNLADELANWVLRINKLCNERDAEIGRLRAALETARHGIMGHFDDDCSDCRETLAVIDAALEGKP